MIDLTKLEAKFDALFEQETEDSFNEWLKDKQKKEVLKALGNGTIEPLAHSFKMIESSIVHPVEIPESEDNFFVRRVSDNNLMAA